jgi:hypothetical protein
MLTPEREAEIRELTKEAEEGIEKPEYLAYAVDDLLVELDRLRFHERVEHLEQLARETSNTALAKIRDAFQGRWGSYVKCSKCGGRLPDSYRLLRVQSPCCLENIIENGYAPPPET